MKGSEKRQTRTKGEDNDKKCQILDCGCCTATTALCLSFDHMRAVHLLIAAGVGTLGPDRVLPLPAASVKSFLVTTHGKENKEHKRFLWCDNISQLQKQSWMEMNE